MCLLSLQSSHLHRFLMFGHTQVRGFYGWRLSSQCPLSFHPSVRYYVSGTSSALVHTTIPARHGSGGYIDDATQSKRRTPSTDRAINLVKRGTLWATRLYHLRASISPCQGRYKVPQVATQWSCKCIYMAGQLSTDPMKLVLSTPLPWPT